MSKININEYEEEDNEKDYLKIKLTSDAFIDGVPSFYKTNPEKFYEDICPIHKVLFKLGNNKPLSINIVYKKLDDEKYIAELLNLFKEWFPFMYDRDYFRKFFIRQNCIAIGAFINIESTDYLVGCVLGEIIGEEKFKKILPDVLTGNNWFLLSDTEPLDCAVLQNLGVIDEYRRLGVGSRLMEKFIDEVKEREGVCVYLNMFEFNKSAIKFFENNQWYYYNTIEKHFKLNGEQYNGIIYYYIIDAKKCKKIVKKKPTNEVNENDKKKYDAISDKDNNDNGISEIAEKKEKGCLASIFSFFSSKKNDE